MTLSVVFNRHVKSYQELVFASDTRLSGGQNNDCAQKVFGLPRSDSMIAFAGDTQYAYPLLMQVFRSIETYLNSQDRRLPLGKLKGQVLSVFQQVYSLIHSMPHGQVRPEDPDNYFLLGGFDWQDQRFIAWRIAFDASIPRFVAVRVADPAEGYGFHFVGDNREAVREAVQRTRLLLAARSRDSRSIDQEPLEVLTEIIKDRNYPSIGGVPQIGKVYRHLNTQLFQTMWTTSEGIRRQISGRPLRENEKCSWPIYEPAVGFYSVRDVRPEVAEPIEEDDALGIGD